MQQQHSCTHGVRHHPIFDKANGPIFNRVMAVSYDEVNLRGLRLGFRDFSFPLYNPLTLFDLGVQPARRLFGEGNIFDMCPLAPWWVEFNPDISYGARIGCRGLFPNSSLQKGNLAMAARDGWTRSRYYV